MIQAIKLVLKEGTTFDLYFLDGSIKRYDILTLAEKHPQLNALKNRKKFLDAKLLGWSGVIWDEELDIEVETPFYDGIDVTNEYDDVENVLLGFLIKQKRIELGLSQAELADKIGIDQSDLSKIEKGVANPSIKTIHRVVSGLDSKLNLSLQ